MKIVIVLLLFVVKTKTWQKVGVKKSLADKSGRECVFAVRHYWLWTTLSAALK